MIVVVISRRRRAIVVALSLASLAVAACASVADLEDPNYNANNNNNNVGDGGPTEDARQKVRESSVEPLDSGLAPQSAFIPFACGTTLGPEDPCSNAAGMGCCIEANRHQCIEQLDASSCNGVFVGCRQGDDDNSCCWMQQGKTKVARFASSCDGGTVACVDGGCPDNEQCNVRTCTSSSDSTHTFVIGQCGVPLGAAPECPQ